MNAVRLAREKDCKEPAPGADKNDELADGGRQHRHQDEHHHDHRHDARHLPANEQVAHDRRDDDPPDGPADPLKEPGCQELLEALCRHRHNRCKHEEREAEQERPATPEAIGKRAPDELPNRHSNHEDRHHEGQLRGIRHAERRADLGERREHDVDRHCAH